MIKNTAGFGRIKLSAICFNIKILNYINIKILEAMSIDWRGESTGKVRLKLWRLQRKVWKWGSEAELTGVKDNPRNLQIEWPEECNGGTIT